jgi:prevent-host-death family protein
MSKAPLLDRRGQPMTTYSATDAKNAFGEVLEKAGMYGAVAITKRDKPRFVVLSIDEYQAGDAAKGEALRVFAARYEEMFERMRTTDPDSMNQALFSRKGKRGRKRA